MMAMLHVKLYLGQIRKYVLSSKGIKTDYTSFAVPIHGVGFSRPSLPIRETCNFSPLKSRVNKWFHSTFIDLCFKSQCTC